MYKDEVLIGSNRFGPFCAAWLATGLDEPDYLWVAVWLYEMVSFIAIPHEDDGLGAPSLFSSTSTRTVKMS